jgi:hypothetical protein
MSTERDAPTDTFGPYCAASEGAPLARRIRSFGGIFAALLVAAVFIPGTARAQVVTAITDTGPVTYQVQAGGTSIQLTIVQIANTTNGTTGTLRLELWAFPSPYSGAAENGYVMATYQLGQLTPDTEYNNISEIVPYTSPPDGTWYVALIITEYTGAATDNGYTPNKYVNFPNTLQIGPVAVAPSITSEPQSQNITAGSSVTFTVGASGTAPLSYQWYFDGSAIPGATGSSYSISSVQSGNAGTYACVVANGQGSVTSTSATLSVTPAVIQPTTLTVTGPYTYTIQPGGTSVQLTVAQILNGNSGGETGTLRLELWAFPAAYSGQLENGYILADYSLGQLAGGTEFNNVSEIVPYTPPPNGTWHLTAFVTEYTDAATDSGYVTDAYANFPDTLVVGPTMPAGTAPTISTQPQSETVSVGGSASFTVGASGTAPLAYQWNFDGTAIPGATASSFTIGSAQSSNAGTYSCTVTNSVGTITSTGATLTVSAAVVQKSSASHLVNLSVRSNTASGSQTLIAGFAIGGTGSISVLARGVGPALTQFGVTGALGDPQLSLFSSTGTEIVSNSGWSSSLASVFAQVGAFLLSDGSSDAALVQSLPVGTYSAEVSSVSGGSGIALVELYDADTGSPTAHFVNLSARCQAGSGSQALIAGFIISGKSGETVLIRGVGPALSAFGVAGAMANPALNLFDSSGNVIASNVGWARHRPGETRPSKPR